MVSGFKFNYGDWALNAQFKPEHLAAGRFSRPFTTSCGDFLDITPLNAVVVENYWEKKSEVESVITSCYFHMQDKGFSQRVIAWGSYGATI